MTEEEYRAQKRKAYMTEYMYNYRRKNKDKLNAWLRKRRQTAKDSKQNLK